jgi:hypothetical protein
MQLGQPECIAEARLPGHRFDRRQWSLLFENLEQVFAYEIDNNPALQMTSDHRAAVEAFLEKRKPVFKGV